jgi:hypothetical protein
MMLRSLAVAALTLAGSGVACRAVGLSARRARRESDAHPHPMWAMGRAAAEKGMRRRGGQLGEVGSGAGQRFSAIGR